MGKKKYTDSLVLNITPKSKSTTYVHKGDGSARIDFSTQSAGDYQLYANIPALMGNDLVIKTIFFDANGKTKTVVSTIKDYQNLNLSGTIDVDTYDHATIDSWQINHGVDAGSGGLYGEVSETESQNFLIAPTGKNEFITLSKGGSDFVYDYKGNDNYDLKSHYQTTRTTFNGKDIIYETDGNDTYLTEDYNRNVIADLKGNDEYEVNGQWAYSKVYDYAGSDKYKTQDGGRFNLEDYKGNEEYSFASNDVSNVKDIAGNDKYLFSTARVDEEIANSYRIADYSGKDNYEIKNSHGINIYDGKGNDTYKVTNCTEVNRQQANTLIYINDSAGNDAYTYDGFQGTSLSAYNDIEDEAGNDKYSFNDTKFLSVSDSKGKDTYTFSGNSRSVYVMDNNGKDKYILTGTEGQSLKDIKLVDYGKSADKYTLSYAQANNTTNAVMDDDGGNDIYNLANCYRMNIYNTEGNDKYTISGSDTNNIFINDDNGKDTYNLKGTKDGRINDINITDRGEASDKYTIQYTDALSISDNGTETKDTYSIKSSSGAIYDHGGNDSYTITNGGVKNAMLVSDSGGKKDSLIFSDLKKDRYVLMTNIKRDTDNPLDTVNKTLIVYDKDTSSFTRIFNFFAYSENSKTYTGYGDGRIETMKAGKKAINTTDCCQFFNEIKGDVAAWLKDGGVYGDVVNVLSQGNQQDINTLVAYFEG